MIYLRAEAYDSLRYGLSILTMLYCSVVLCDDCLDGSASGVISLSSVCKARLVT